MCVSVSVCRVFNLFLSFLHRPDLPLQPRLPAYHYRPFSLTPSSFDLVLSRPPLLLLLLILLLLSRFSLFVKTISTHHSFPPPVQLNSLLL